MLRDDGVLVVTTGDGVVSWWQTTHGGIAHTPIAAYRFANQRSGLAPEPPYAREIEREPVWRWDGEGSGEGSGAP